MKKKEENLLEQVFLTCRECTGPMHFTNDDLDEAGNLILIATCEICETVWEHTVITMVA